MAGGDRSDIDFAALMPDVAVRLLGEPNRRLSTETDLRFGTNGSLSIDLASGRWFDHEAKAGGGVLDLIARETGQANGEAVDWLREHGFPVEDDGPGPSAAVAAGRGARGGAGRIVATYDYVDETGDLLFQVVRFEPKKFLQRRRPLARDHEDKVKDGWVWSVKGVRQVPYRYPEVVEAIGLERPVFIVEGEKDADALWKLGIAATCNAMGAGKWPEALNDAFRGADVVLVPDNDAAGEDHIAMVGAAMSGVAASVRVLRLPGLPDKGDVSDWLAAGGDASGFYELVARARPIGAEAQRLHFGSVWFEEAEGALDGPEWLVDDFLTRGDMSLVYGESKSGKSFLATHLAMAIARGEEVFDRKVHQGGVVYIAAEGKRGFKKRLTAYRVRHDIKSGTVLPFVLVPSAVDLYAKDGDTERLVGDLRIIEPEMQRRGARTELIVVDTYAAVSPGANENASEDVSRIVKNVLRFREVVPYAHIMVIHHKNAAGERPRGHGSLYAGIDNAIEVTCDEAKNRRAKVDKMKDGQDGIAIAFRLETVELGQRGDGKPITSCVVVSSTMEGEGPRKGPYMSDQQRIALQALREAIIDHGEPAPGALQLPWGVTVVRVEHWKREFLKRGFSEPPNESTFRMAFKRVGEALLARAIIGRDQPYVWIAREPSK